MRRRLRSKYQTDNEYIRRVDERVEPLGAEVRVQKSEVGIWKGTTSIRSPLAYLATTYFPRQSGAIAIQARPTLGASMRRRLRSK
ncbi:MAG: hypothetical protein ACYCVD_12955 [Desulfitobacteriaceae bacterium]